MTQHRQHARSKVALYAASGVLGVTLMLIFGMPSLLRQTGSALPWPPDAIPYSDFAWSYDAPRVDAVSGPGTLPARPRAIHYEPEARNVYLGELRVRDLDHEGRTIFGNLEDVRPYEGVKCGDNCLNVNMMVEDGPVALHIPVPPGERVDVDSVRFGGVRVPVYATSADEPIILLRQRVRALLSYRTGRGPSRFLPPSQGRPLPEQLERRVRAWRSRPREEQVQRASAYVRKTLRYSQDPMESVPTPWIPNESFLSRTMRAGVGDCDVQNAMLMLILQELGIPARMGVGFVGRNGGVAWVAHAWVEYQREDGSLGVADATKKPQATEPLPELPEEEEVVRATTTASDPSTPR